MRKLILLNAIISAVYVMTIAILIDIIEPIYTDVANGLYASLTVYGIIQVINMIVSAFIYNKNVDQE